MNHLMLTIAAPVASLVAGAGHFSYTVAGIPQVGLGVIGSVTNILIAILVSLCVEFAPLYAEKWRNLTSKQRAFFMGLFAVLSSVLLIVADYVGMIGLDYPRPLFWDGFWAFIVAISSWLGAAQATYTIGRMANILPRKKESV